ncbi:hypothetical protein CJJ07_004039 [Candidozyma auris]|nr:hypothetical protein CJJ07_004039 [[Candida] auris]QEL63300.1 hypothetical protein CJJ09_005499 [[Candida] auris]
MLWLHVVFTAFFATLAFAVNPFEGASWENTKYYRNVDLAKSYVKEWALIEATNVGEQPLDTYFFLINDGFDAVPEVSFLGVTLTERSQEIQPFAVENGVYMLKLPFPVAPGNSVEFKVRYTYSNTLYPFPETIKLDDKQKLLLKMNKFPLSGYPTEEYSLAFTGITKGQEMDLQLININATKEVPELKGRVEDNLLVYGPVKAYIKPLTIVPMGFLYDHDLPIARVINLERSFWLPASDVDIVQTEEYYELTNNGAELKDGFSRIDWMKGRYEILRKHFALAQLEFPIDEKIPFDNYYVTDKVGMVSTHQIKSDHLIVVPRYPLMGGWNYNFTLGWTNKLENFVHKAKDEPDTYIAAVPLLNTLKDIYYDNVSMQIYLPEGAEFVNYSSPIVPENLSVSDERSYLDFSSGHVKVTATYKNLYDDLGSLTAYVKYRYTPKAYWMKVGRIAALVFTGLAAYFMLGQLDLSTK